MLNKFLVIKPINKLSEFIEGYNMYSASLNNDLKNSMIPEGIVEIVFHLNSSTAQSNYLGISKKRKNAFVGGIHSKGWKIDVLKTGELLSIRFKPGCFSFFTNIPVNLLRNQKMSLEDVWGNKDRFLEQRIMELEKLHDKIQLIEAFLISKYQKHKYHHIIKASQQMQNSTSTSIKTFSEMCNYNPSRFRTLFNEMIGCPPKEFQSIRRLNQAVAKKSKTPTLTMLSLESGYFDQSHFIKECKKITGQNPRQFFHQSLIESFS